MQEDQISEVTHFASQPTPARDSGAAAVQPASDYLDQLPQENVDEENEQDDGGDGFLSEDEAGELDAQELSDEAKAQALFNMDGQLNILRDRMKTLWQHLPEDDPDVKLLREFAEGESALIPGQGETREIYLKKMRRIVTANAIAAAKAKALVLEGQPVDITLEIYVPSTNSVVPSKPMEHLVAVKTFNQSTTAFEFYSKNFGYALILNSGPMVDYASRNIARIKYAEYLKENGLVRVATAEEIEKIEADIKEAEKAAAAQQPKRKRA